MRNHRDLTKIKRASYKLRRRQRHLLVINVDQRNFTDTER